jgi:hypothetical protein
MDKIEIEITEDGLLKIVTPGISAANHRNADAFLDTVKKMTGTEIESTPVKSTHGHHGIRRQQTA